MFHLIVGGTAIFMGIFGLLANLYILLILIFTSKTKSSGELILLHLSSCGLSTSLVILVFSCSSILLRSWIFSSSAFCDSVGVIFLQLQLLTVWTICALSADRCFAIVSPLRYTQIVTRQRIFFYFLLVWLLSIFIVFTAFLATPSELKIINATSTSSSPNLQGFTTPFESEIDLTLTDGGGWDHPEIVLNQSDIVYSYDHYTDSINNESDRVFQGGVEETGILLEFRPLVGLCLPKMSSEGLPNLSQIIWTSEWAIFILIAPAGSLLVCDLIVLSIARKQRHRIVMALYQVTLSAQATVTRSKGTAPPSLWLNQSVPHRSRAFRALWEDLINLFALNFPFILIIILEMFICDHSAPYVILSIGSIAFASGPTLNALLYGVRARPLRAAYKSYLRKRLTKSTLVQEIQNRLSPVDGSPQPNSRNRSYRSNTNSQNSSPIQTPRRLSTHELRPPDLQYILTSSPSQDNLGRNGHNNNFASSTARRVRSFLNIPFQGGDMTEFWSGLRRPNRSPTIVITHEFRNKDEGSNANSIVQSPVDAEQRL